MNEENELLEIMYKDCYMACKNMEVLLEEIKDKDNKIKGKLENILKSYEKYVKDIKKYLKSNKIKPKRVSKFALMGAKMKMKKDVKNDNSDSKISDIVIQGLVMGIIDINKRLDDYRSIVDKDIITMCENLLVFQQDSVNELKCYL